MQSPCDELMSRLAHYVPLTEHMLLLLSLHYVLVIVVIMTMFIGCNKKPEAMKIMVIAMIAIMMMKRILMN